MPNRLPVQLPHRNPRVRPALAVPNRALAEPVPETSFPVQTIPVAGLDRTVRVAAIGDFHTRVDRDFPFGSALRRVPAQADLLLIAGDLTDNGRIDQFALVAAYLADVTVPVVAVLGNHDRRGLRRVAIRRTLEEAGVILLDGEAVVLDVPMAAIPDANDVADRIAPSSARIEVIGFGGYGGGFWPEEMAESPPLHRATQAVAVRARREAARLDATLAAARTDVDARIVLLHYSPTSSTLGREPSVKYWMLGNIELARVIDRHDVDLVIHGHAHLGNPAGQTIGGTPVRNVASPVIGRPVIYRLVDASADASDQPVMPSAGAR